MSWSKISPRVFELDPGIRYLAVNQEGEIVEMEQRLPTHNPAETDRMEELLVNPTILEMTKRRADLDLDGISYIIIRYGLQYQAVFNYRNGHVSVGIESDSDAVGVVTKILEHLDSPAPSPEVLRRPSRIAAARTKQHLGAI
jgi:hypothetical protein